MGIFLTMAATCIEIIEETTKATAVAAEATELNTFGFLSGLFQIVPRSRWIGNSIAAGP